MLFSLQREAGARVPPFRISKPLLNPCYDLHEVLHYYVQDTFYHTLGEHLAAKTIIYYLRRHTTYR